MSAMIGGGVPSLDVARITVDDWCDHDSHDAKFSKIPPYVKVVGFECNLTCYHNGNYVGGRGRGPHIGDAFLAALKQIELTIGKDWRNK